MLKSELEARIKELECKRAELISERGALKQIVRGKDEQIKELESRVDYNETQMKKLSQSIYTILQVKYPDTYQMNPGEPAEGK